MAKRRGQNSRRGARYASLLGADDGTYMEPARGAGRHSATYAPRAGAYQRRAVKAPSSAGKAPILIAILVLVGMGGGGWWFWQHRPVNVTVNGKITDIPINTTVDEAREQLGVDVAPGNLISVGGNVLTPGGGEAYSVQVNGEPKTMAEASDIRISGGERIDYSTGADVFEEYTSEVTETPPKLEFDGDWGSISYVAQWGKAHRQEIRHGSLSGETAEGDVLQQGQNCIVKMTSPEPGDQLVALTFDDGPSAYTQTYLDILSQYGAHATFFNLATEQEAYPDLARAIVESGNEIMSHTTNHLQLTALDPEEMRSEISGAAETIERITGVKTTSIRPPYGDFSQRCWLDSQGLISLSVLWTQDSEDWRRQGVSVIVRNALASISSGSIILMHDGGGNRDMDVDALPQIIEGLQESGYQLVTISELLRACPDVPEDVASGNAPMPEDAMWPTEMA